LKNLALIWGLAGIVCTSHVLAQVPAPEPPPPNPDNWWEQKEDEPKPSSTFQPKFELGLRGGYALPFGKVSDSATDDISALVSGQVPIWLHAGVRLPKGVTLGFYFSYGVDVFGGGVGSLCGSSVDGARLSCHGFDLRSGPQFLYHAPVTPLLDPWVGAGLGWEVLKITASAQSQASTAKLDVSASGIELFMLEAGLDFKLAESFGLGPFVAYSAGMFSNSSVSCQGDCTGVPTGGGDIAQKTVHSWTFFGARVVVRP
jgi:hypothetical protein